MRVRGESGHVDADLGDQFGGCYRVDAGNLSKPGRLAGERADPLFDAGIEHGDLGADPIGVVKHHAQDRRVVVGEKSPQPLFKLGGLLTCPGPWPAGPAHADRAVRRSRRPSSLAL
jgi:hypothetical protein